uniref:Ig-like domain-containing protein n=1 Tax=Dicentrarchus labrax TaxID=13489 RepID=A0A8C4DPT6_DICLA
QIIYESKVIFPLCFTLVRLQPQTVMAAVGEEAHLNCQLMQNKDVVQVTWWKPEGDKTLATSSKHFGPRVIPDFIDKVEFKDDGLQNNSIVIRNLTEQDEGCYHCLFNSYPEGALTGITCLTALVQTQQTVLAAMGDEACLNCQLSQSKDVLQVTWQKVSPEKEENVATFNRYFGPRVNPDFIDKVEFKDAGLQNNSIVIRNLTDQDKGYYRCLFNTYPDGALTAITCLQVYGKNILNIHTAEDAIYFTSDLQKVMEMCIIFNNHSDVINVLCVPVCPCVSLCVLCVLCVPVCPCVSCAELHEPILHVRESNSSEEAVVSCSATGRPAPTVTLRVLQQDLHFSNYSSVSLTNTNGTVAVTTTAVLSGYRGNSPEVGCAARVLSGPQIEVFMMIPEVKQSSADGEKHFQTYTFRD